MVKNGVPYDVAHCLEVHELMAWSITFAQFENGNKEWDWDKQAFIEK